MEYSNWYAGLLLLAAAVSCHQLLQYYQRHISPTPIVGTTVFDFLSGLVGDSSLGPKWYKDAYQKYSKNSRAFRTDSNTYTLPISAMSEYRKLGPLILDATGINDDLLFLKGNLGHDDFGHDNWDLLRFIQGHITRSLDKLIPPALDEIQAVFPKYFLETTSRIRTEDGEIWHDVVLSPQVFRSVGHIINRILVGPQLGANDSWVKHSTGFAHCIGVQTFFIHLITDYCPPFILNQLPAGKHRQALEPMLKPEVMRYIRNPGEQGGHENQDPHLLVSLVDYVQTSPLYEGASEEDIYQGVKMRLCNLLFAMVDTTSISFTHILLDLASFPQSEYADPIREEIKQVLDQNDGHWTSSALNQLKLLDSFIKESMRLHPLSAVLAFRRVVSKGGYTFSPKLPGASSLYIPQGGITQLPVLGIHLDPDNYTDPGTFQGFRFAPDGVASSHLSDKFLSFGHGKHACPGRFLALQILKLMTIEFLTKYDWKQTTRPSTKYIGANGVPNDSHKLHLRQRH